MALDLHDYPTALQRFQQLEERASSLRQRDFKCEALRGQAAALTQMGRTEEALHAAQQAYDIAIQQNDGLRQSMILWVFAKIYAAHELPRPAGIEQETPTLHYLLRALQVAEQIDGFTVAAELYEALGEAYAQVGQYQQAYQLGLKAGQARQKTQNQFASKRAGDSNSPANRKSATCTMRGYWSLMIIRVRRTSWRNICKAWCNKSMSTTAPAPRNKPCGRRRAKVGHTPSCLPICICQKWMA